VGLWAVGCVAREDRVRWGSAREAGGSGAMDEGRGLPRRRKGARVSASGCPTKTGRGCEPLRAERARQREGGGGEAGEREGTRS
jgi:hypothetical protein